MLAPITAFLQVYTVQRPAEVGGALQPAYLRRSNLHGSYRCAALLAQWNLGLSAHLRD